MNKSDLIKIINVFKDKNICVIGDLILDRYIFGDVERISPEAPIPIVLVSEEFSTPGGAGNVAHNIAALGGNVSVVGMIGKDEAGGQLLQEFKNKGIDTEGIIVDDKKQTTQKTRIIARKQHVLRIDKENNNYIDTYCEKKIIDFVDSSINKWDCLIISDYAKGLITNTLVRKIIDTSVKNKKYIIGDTKPLHATFFKNVFLLTPNAKEAKEITGLADIDKAGIKIQKQLHCNVLITQGSQGMTLFEGQKIKCFPTKSQEVFDVSGAGDTVVAAMALSLASTPDLEKAAIIANHAAGIVVSKVGTATVSATELKEDLRSYE